MMDPRSRRAVSIGLLIGFACVVIVPAVAMFASLRLSPGEVAMDLNVAKERLTSSRASRLESGLRAFALQGGPRTSDQWEAILQVICSRPGLTGEQAALLRKILRAGDGPHLEWELIELYLHGREDCADPELLHQLVADALRFRDQRYEILEGADIDASEHLRSVHSARWGR